MNGITNRKNMNTATGVGPRKPAIASFSLLPSEATSLARLKRSTTPRIILTDPTGSTRRLPRLAFRAA